MSSQSDTNQTTLTHILVSQRNRCERGEVAKTWNRSNKAGHRNEIGQTAKTETKTPAPNSGRGLAQELQKINPKGGLLITTSIKKPHEGMRHSQKPHQFTRRFGSTVFKVAVHMNPNAKETAETKIARLVRMEADTGKVGVV